jgi:hypothetical protein
MSEFKFTLERVVHFGCIAGRGVQAGGVLVGPVNIAAWGQASSKGPWGPGAGPLGQAKAVAPTFRKNCGITFGVLPGGVVSPVSVGPRLMALGPTTQGST